MTSFWKVVNQVIDESDVVLEVLDARYPEETRNKEIENKLIKQHKKIIYILNKSDLIKEKFSDLKFDFEPYVFVSAKNNLGTTKLRGIIRDLARDKRRSYEMLKKSVSKTKVKEQPLLVGVLGYPNTGKSSLINVLKQKKSALTSSTPGFTRGMQKIRIGKDIYLIDTPGVFAYKEYKKEDIRHTLVNIKDYRKIKLKGGVANIDQTSRRIIQDWQRGRLII
ncbi:50S ribosome-binding GTPase [Candidatus Woesearchaeota archaeon]|nr:50S ribosome-binding GTPase [Candidatus Woesearchaeota archaeon]